MTIRTKLLRIEKGTYNHEKMRKNRELKIEEHWKGYQISAETLWMLKELVSVEEIA